MNAEKSRVARQVAELRHTGMTFAQIRERLALDMTVQGLHYLVRQVEEGRECAACRCIIKEEHFEEHVGSSKCLREAVLGGFVAIDEAGRWHGNYES